MQAIKDQFLLTWIPLLPILAAAIHGFYGKHADKSLVAGLGVGSVATSFVLAVLAAARVWGGPEGAALTADFGTWFSLQAGGQSLAIPVAFTMDGLSALMSVMVTGIALLIHVYAASYMHDDAGFARFFAYLNLFTGSMLVLVLASSLPVMFVGWEGVGVCSYLLIGFWFTNPVYAAAAKKAFVVNRIGDLGVLLAMFLLSTHVGSVEFGRINAAAAGLGFVQVSPALPVSVLTAAVLLLFLGCAGKSAQLPLYVWLPDAMAGPTPVSALIHAATMVTAGVYLACRLSGLFAASAVAMTVVATVGAATALLAATIALAQKDLKKILAYSTVSQLGFMFAAVGVGAFTAGIFHVFTHAFFKACLFLGAGSVMHAVNAHGDADITKLGGLSKITKVTAATFIVAALALAGFPGLAGFFSKDAILAGAAGFALYGGATGAAKAAAWFVLVSLVLVSVLTAFYMTRCVALTFLGSYRGAEGGYEAEPHESPAAMTAPLVVLALGSVLVGWLGFLKVGDATRFEALLGSAVRATPAYAHEAHGLAMGLGTVAALAGIGLGLLLYKGQSTDVLAEKLPPRLLAFLADAWRVDALYDCIVVRPLAWLAQFVDAIDDTLVRALSLRAPAFASGLAARGLVTLQDGHMQTYGLAMAAGLVGVFGFLQAPRGDIESQADGTVVTFTVGGGLGQKVRVDYESDGTFDTELGADTEFTHRYDISDVRGVLLEVRPPPHKIPSFVEVPTAGRTLGSSELGLQFRRRMVGQASPSLPVYVRHVRDGRRPHVLVRGNGEPVTLLGQSQGRDGGDVEATYGAALSIGNTQARVVPVVRATFEIVTVYGQTRRVRHDVPLVATRRSAAAAAEEGAR